MYSRPSFWMAPAPFGGRATVASSAILFHCWTVLSAEFRKGQAASAVLHTRNAARRMRDTCAVTQRRAVDRSAAMFDALSFRTHPDIVGRRWTSISIGPSGLIGSGLRILAIARMRTMI